LIAKEILALRKEVQPLPPTPYVVLELASRCKIEPWEGYDASSSYLANIRRLVDHILKGDGIKYLNTRKCEAGKDRPRVDDPYGADVDWGSPREARRAVTALLPNTRRAERLRRKLGCVA
jgi:hypothetical protein